MTGGPEGDSGITIGHWVAKAQAFNELVRRLTFPAPPPRVDGLGVEVHPPANLRHTPAGQLRELARFAFVRLQASRAIDSGSSGDNILASPLPLQ
jgi:hypothetical protein